MRWSTKEGTSSPGVGSRCWYNCGGEEEDVSRLPAAGEVAAPSRARSGLGGAAGRFAADIVCIGGGVERGGDDGGCCRGALAAAAPPAEALGGGCFAGGVVNPAEVAGEEVAEEGPVSSAMRLFAGAVGLKAPYGFVGSAWRSPELCFGRGLLPLRLRRVTTCVDDTGTGCFAETRGDRLDTGGRYLTSSAREPLGCFSAEGSRFGGGVAAPRAGASRRRTVTSRVEACCVG